MPTQPTFKNSLKHALLSIAIGFIISAMTVIFQESVAWLRHIQPEVPGSITGIAVYLKKLQSFYSA